MYIYILHFPGRNGESCSKDNQCLSPQTCVNEICTCPPNTAYATFDLGGLILSEKCIPNSRKFFVIVIIMCNVMLTRVCGTTRIFASSLIRNQGIVSLQICLMNLFVV